MEVQQTLKYELKELEQMVPTKMRSTAIKKPVRNEIDRIKETLIHDVFAIEDENHLRRYVQYHQQALIRLMDMATLSLNNGKGHKDDYKVYYEGVGGLLLFVEQHFAKYFDLDAKAPEDYISEARTEFRKSISKLQQLLEVKKANSGLVKLILHVFQRITSSYTDGEITYRRVMYARELQKCLFRLLDCDYEIEDVDEELRQIIYYLNYNSVKVLTYHARFITQRLEESETRAEKLEQLSLMLKKVNQAQVKPGICYSQQGGMLKDQLCAYISEEIVYQEKLQQLFGGTSNGTDDSTLDRFKLKLDVSVMQLAYLLKVLLETKIILNSNLSQILHFLVKFVVTKRCDVISYGSFRSKFYSVETGTKESVRNMLLSMIRYIERN
ncbi:MAG: hypothetical protein ABJH04_08725 [Cyclobacteriaceae bacterium]|jgi:hypothetical protein